MSLHLVTLTPADASWPERVSMRLRDGAPETLFLMGERKLLKVGLTALLCSTRTPGDAILRSHDTAQRWRDDGVAVVSGFHSPIEKECLRILLRGKQPIIMCLARGLGDMRLPSEWRKPLEDERLLVLSGFAATVRRVTKDLAVTRNRLVAALADEIVFAHVTPGGHLDALRRTVEGWGIRSRTLLGAGEGAAHPLR
jgi:predicted Rossmann fold nucleotide-binding protein DprA/Smf involved in DNA uptake